jgi:hypothetical protein
MADAVRKLSVRLSVDNAQRAKAELREVGESGHRSLQQIVTGASAASAALRLLGPVIAGLGVGALAANRVVGRAYAEYLANADLATAIPRDDTIPQVTEGTQILALTHTPQAATNRIRIACQGFCIAA